MTLHRDASLELLDQRRSTPVSGLHEPAPDPGQLRQILRSAVRVPDHGRLAPWRILEIPTEERNVFADAVVQRHRACDPAISDAHIAKDRQRFGDSPMLLVVIARLDDAHKVPVQEQLLSGGCVCFALLQAAQALGFAGQWLTGWAAYDDGVAHILGLAGNERVLGFLHLGTAKQETPERNRPALDNVFSRWTR